jgi:WD40 repeat protein
VSQSAAQTDEFRNGGGHASPYQGLGFYTEADARWFFGRGTERKIILAHARTARLTVLYAESGVGKSSLLRAGVAARLGELAAQNIARGGSPRFVPIVFSAWKDDPVDDLIAEIERQVGRLTPRSDLELSGNGHAPRAAAPRTGLADAIHAAAHGIQATLVIILDQFEEHFSYRLAGDRPDRLADELAQCVNSPDVPANFLIAVREDAYGGLGDLFSGRIANVYGNYLHLEYLTRDEARDAIERPIEVYNADHDEEDAVSLDDHLADAVLDEVRRGKLELGTGRPDRDGPAGEFGAHEDQIETPFLQLVMTRLWDYERCRGSLVLRSTTLNDELGGAETIVRNHVDRALAGLEGRELETATDIFHDLVTPSGVKVAHTAGDLAQMTAHSEDTVVSVLGRLYEERILRAVDPAPGTTQARYEIFHDRLAAPILDWRTQQQNARLERDKQQAEEEARVQRTQARRYRRRARIMLILVVSLLALLAGGVVLLRYAQNERDKARHDNRVATTERREATYAGLTAAAQSQLSNRPDVAALLSLAAYAARPQAIAERNVVATLNAVERSGAVGVLHGHTGPVESIAFDPAGTTLASAGVDGTIRLWTVTGNGQYPRGRPLRAKGPQYSVAWNPTGQILASGGFNGIILWSAARREEQRTIRYSTGGPVESVAFSPDGKTLAAAGADGTVLLWDVATHQRTLVRVAPSGPVRGIAFSPDGHELAMVRPGTNSPPVPAAVVIWNLSTLQQVGQPLSTTGDLYGVAFSPDGKSVAASGSSNTVRLWDLGAPYLPPRMLVGNRPLYSVAFSAGGRYIAAGGDNQTVFWDLNSHRNFGMFVGGHQGSVYSVAFNPRARMFAAAGADGTITIYRYPLGVRFGRPLAHHKGPVTSVAISPDDRLVASGSSDGRVVLTDSATGARVRVLPADGQEVGAVAFDPSGRVLASGYYNGQIRFWNVASGMEIGPPIQSHGSMFSLGFDPKGTMVVSGGSDGHVRLWSVATHRELGHALALLGAVYTVTFSPDGAVIAAGGNERAIRLWSASTLRPLHPPLIAEEDAVFSLAFSPDGRILAAGGADDAIRLWNVYPHAYVPRATLTGDTNYVRSVAFSPDGKTLASGSSDSLIRLWDVSSGTELGDPLAGHLRSVESVAFANNGQFLVSGGQDKTVRKWPAVNIPPSFTDLRNEVCRFVGSGLSSSEWKQYAPNIQPVRGECPRATPN